MKRRSVLAAISAAMAVAPGRAQLRSPDQWLERDGTPRISSTAFGAYGQLRVWLVAMPMPLWRAWWNLLPVQSETPRLIDGLIQSYLPDDEISLSLLVTGALRDDSRKRRLVASVTTVAPDGRANPPTRQDYFWEGMPFNRSNSIGILEPVLGVSDHVGRPAGTWQLHAEVTDTLASVSVSMTQKVNVGA
jgi:hypothetical protein